MTTSWREKPVIPDAEMMRILNARHHDPFSFLGRHHENGRTIIRVLRPHVISVEILVEHNTYQMQRVASTDLFTWESETMPADKHYRLRFRDNDGNQWETDDPYCFMPQIPDLDLHLFNEGRHWHAYRFLGAHPWKTEGISGVRFAVWAPNAERVSVVGPFNRWDGRVHPMRARGGSGVWELFIPGLRAGDMYKFEIRNRHNGSLKTKADPYGQQFEFRPSTSSIVCSNADYTWHDHHWLEKRKQSDWLNRPVSIYEVHLGSWQKNGENYSTYRDLAHELVDYVKEHGFNYIELLPVMEHPFDGSWGYQVTGYYAPTSRFGTPEDFRYFVNHCHQHDIGVILDWVPAHFPKDEHALARFDGDFLYEHEDPRKGEHQDWGTLIFNYGRNEVRNFLLANAIYWLEEFHIDGLRVDAVASMLYLDYSREPGEWVPNQFGGRENLEAVDFLRQANEIIHERFPGALMIAEESTSWPQVSRPVWLGGLGFSMKWDMGWMNDTLQYMQRNPVHRHYHHQEITFGMMYAHTENFVLPFSHDEVVHQKRSMLEKMPGDDWQKFANLRLLYSYQFTYPGKKLLFMGNEIAQRSEWNHAREIDWWLLEHESHQGIQKTVQALNHIYLNEPALHRYEFEEQGFEWLDCNDNLQSTLSYLRKTENDFIVVCLNFTPVPRYQFRLGVPASGYYTEIFNSDSRYYWGSDVGNDGGVQSEAIAWMNHPHSISITLPPLSAVFFKLT